MNEIDAYAADRRRAYREARQKARRAKVRRQRLTAAVIIAIAILLVAAAIPAKEGSHAEAPVEAARGYILKTTGAAELHTPTITNPPVAADTPSETPEAAAEYKPDAAEVEALARMLYGEARGIASDMEKAACVWCVLNRVDDPRFPDTVMEVLEAPYQFSGYKADYPVLPELEEIAADVLTRYQAERDGDTGAGRVLPVEYVFFTGDGKHNHFTAEWKNGIAYQWTLTNPYED